MATGLLTGPIVVAAKHVEVVRKQGQERVPTRLPLVVVAVVRDLARNLCHVTLPLARVSINFIS